MSRARPRKRPSCPTLRRSFAGQPLADLAHAGWQTSDWARVMLHRRRKTVVACDTCHDRIYSERPAKPFTP
ncbi:hypothetical protein ACIPSJ_40960 [Streptomyces sp. NPDC090088]|uniref:HNH endonuclease n=1 Tax=Streptomyces sp. NPDC090088 TaxID=3365944 RepID=UPI00380020FB